MGKRLLAWLVTCLLALYPSTVLSQDVSKITSVRADVMVLTNMYSEENLELTYLGVSGSVLGDEFRLPGKVTELKVTDSLGALDYTIRSSANLTVIRYLFRSPLREGDEEKVKLSYLSSNFTSKSGNLWQYSTVFLAGSDVDEWSVRLEMPEEVQVYLPSGKAREHLRSVYYNSGRTVCEWTATGTDSLPVAIGHSPLAPSKDSRLVLYLVLAAIVFIVALVAYLLRSLLWPKPGKATDIAIKVLDGRERRIVRELADGKRATQAELVRATKLSKATISRAVVALERRGVVEREKSGRVKRVKLSDWLLEG